MGDCGGELRVQHYHVRLCLDVAVRPDEQFPLPDAVEAAVLAVLKMDEYGDNRASKRLDDELRASALPGEVLRIEISPAR